MVTTGRAHRYKLLAVSEHVVLDAIMRRGLSETALFLTFKDVPLDVKVESVHHRPEYKAFLFTIWHESFPEVALGQELPIVTAEGCGEIRRMVEPRPTDKMEFLGPSPLAGLYPVWREKERRTVCLPSLSSFVPEPEIMPLKPCPGEMDFVKTCEEIDKLNDRAYQTLKADQQAMLGIASCDSSPVIADPLVEKNCDFLIGPGGDECTIVKE